MRTNYVHAALLAVLLVFLSACGGGGGGDSGPNSGTPLNGQFIDSVVSGIRFEATPSGLTGTTDASGTYTYKAGDTVEFFIGDISLGSAPAAPIITPVSIVTSMTGGSVDTTNTTVQNIARFLLSIDEDGDPSNGIQIPAEIVAAAAGASLDFSSVTFDTDAATVLAALASSAGIPAITGMLVDAASAMSHLIDSIATCEFTGSYSGTWQQTSPDTSDSGVWTFSVTTTGTLTGNGGSNVFPEDNFEMTGTISPSGDTEVTAGSTTTGASFSGTVDAAGNISGTWSNSTYGTSGTFTGSRSADSSVSCGGSSSPSPEPTLDLGSLNVTGADVTSGSVTSTFTPLLGPANIIITPTEETFVIWTDLDTSNPPTTIGSVTHQLEVTFVNATSEIVGIRFRSTHLGIGSYFYSLDCTLGTCGGLGVTIDATAQQVTFTDAILIATDMLGNSATASITVSGTVTYYF